MEFDEKQLPPKPDPNWREKCKIFMRMRPITKNDLVSGKNEIQHLTADEFFGRVASSKEENDEKKYKFGKYKGRSYEWVKTNDPAYYQWCIANVRGFEDGNL